jgi:hypothetical protein
MKFNLPTNHPLNASNPKQIAGIISGSFWEATHPSDIYYLSKAFKPSARARVVSNPDWDGKRQDTKTKTVLTKDESVLAARRWVHTVFDVFSHRLGVEYTHAIHAFKSYTGSNADRINSALYVAAGRYHVRKTGKGSDVGLDEFISKAKIAWNQSIAISRPVVDPAKELLQFYNSRQNVTANSKR